MKNFTLRNQKLKIRSSEKDSGFFFVLQDLYKKRKNHALQALHLIKIINLRGIFLSCVVLYHLQIILANWWQNRWGQAVNSYPGCSPWWAKQTSPAPHLTKTVPWSFMSVLKILEKCRFEKTDPALMLEKTCMSVFTLNVWVVSRSINQSRSGSSWNMLFVLKYTLPYSNFPSSDEAKKVRNRVPVLGMTPKHSTKHQQLRLHIISFSNGYLPQIFTKWPQWPLLLCYLSNKNVKGTFYLAVVYDCDEDKLLQ